MTTQNQNTAPSQQTLLTFPAPSGMSASHPRAPIEGAGKLPQLQPTPVNTTGPSISHDDARKLIENTPVPSNVWRPNQVPAGAQSLAASNLVSAPASIVELARGLKNNVDLIHEYCVTQIDFTPIQGLQKGALGAIIDQRGSSFDHADVMVQLLRQAGYTANYLYGELRISLAEATAWLATNPVDIFNARNMLNNGGIPAVVTNVAGTNYLDFSHCWVKVNIGGTWYVFDPSRKSYTTTSSINLATAMSYNQTTFVNSAQVGATVNTDYVQNINRTNIRNNLTTMTANLVNWIKTNNSGATVEDIIGGRTINGITLGQRLTSLGYEKPGSTPVEWTSIPDTYKHALRVIYDQPNIDVTFFSADIYGKRLTLFFNASHQAELRLDGTLIATSSAQWVGSWNSVGLIATHPYGATWADQGQWYRVYADYFYSIANAWGVCGPRMKEIQTAKYFENVAAGGAPNSESVLGQQLSAMFHALNTEGQRAHDIKDKLNLCMSIFHHQVGVAGDIGAPLFDIGMVNRSSLPLDGNYNRLYANDLPMHGVTFESSAIQEMTGPLGVSATTVVDLASQNGLKIYNAKTSNWLSTVKPTLTGYDAGTISYYETNYINAGWRICMPSDGAQVLGLFTGYGLFLLQPSSTANYGVIGGTKGSFGQAPISKQPDKAPIDGFKAGPSSIKYQDGNFSWAHNDLTLGSQSEPYGLSFTRYYQSANAKSDGPLGRGWSHSFNITATVGSGSMAGLAKNSPIAGAAAIVEMFVTCDLLADTTQPHNKFVIALLANKWLGDQLVNNIVTIGSATNGAQFVKMPNGTYENPFKVAGTLVKNPDNTFTYKTTKQVAYNFNLDGTINTIVYPFGVTWTFGYTSGKLTTVTNGMGRTITLVYTGTRLTSITDGTGRSVVFTVNPTSGLLTSVTDPNSKNWTYAYDASNRMTQVFYPANPTQAIFTNTYDSVGQVKERRDAYNNLTSYYYAGYRTEVVSPNNKSAVVYLNALGDVIKSISQVGKITTREYDGRGRVKKNTQPEGNYALYTYDSKDNVLTVTDVAKPGSGLANIVQTFTYNATFNKIATGKDGKNQTTTFTYDAINGNLLTVQRPTVAGKVPKTRYKYNARGQIVSAIDGTGMQVQWTYDSSTERKLSQIVNTDWRCTVGGTVTVGNVLTINVNDSGLPGGTKAKSYTVISGDTLAKIATGLANAINGDTDLASLGIIANANGSVIALSTSPGNTTTFTGSTPGATATLTLAAGLNLTTTFGHNTRGDITSITDPRGKITTFNFDVLRRRIQSTSPAPFNYVSKATYDDNGNKIKDERQTNIVATPWQTYNTTYSFDNKVLTVQDPSADTTTCAYNNLRLLQQVTDAASRVTQYTYDDAGRLSTVIDSSSVTAMTKTYTDNGLVATTKDSRNNLTAYTYDGFDRLSRRTFPDSSYVEIQSYDANSNALVSRMRNGGTITLTYDALDRISTKTPTSMAVVTYTYDLANRVLTASKPTVAGDASTGTFTISYDSAGRAVQEIYPGSKIFTNTLDANGNVTKITWPDGYFVEQTFDELNRLTTVKLNGSTTAAATYVWDALSRPSNISRKNSTSTSYVWEIDNDLSSVSQSFAGPTLLPSTLTYAYAYNGAGELSSQTVSDSQYLWHPGAAGTIAYGTADSTDHYPTVGGTTQIYDGNGNLSQQGVTNFYGFNTELQLSSATTGGVSTSYNYDPFGRMVQETVGSTASRSYYLSSTLMGDYSGTGVLQSRYVYGAFGEPLAKVTSAGVESFYHTDGQNSVVAISDATGNVTNRYAYSPFGETATALAGTKFGYQSAVYDSASSLYLTLNGVSYLPSFGRTGQDGFSMGSAANPGNPGDYYDPNDPMNYDSDSAITRMLRNGSQTNRQYMDMLAQQQAAIDKIVQNLIDKYDLNAALKKGGVGSGHSWLQDADTLAKYLLDALKLWLGEDDFDYLKAKHTDSENIEKALEQMLEKTLTGGLSVLGKNVVGGFGKQVEKKVVGEFGKLVIKTQEFMKNEMGRRFYDLTTNEARHEVKSGLVEFTPRIAMQILKDSANTLAGKPVVWLFKPSPQTGLVGPSDLVANLLRQANISYIISHK